MVENCDLGSNQCCVTSVNRTRQIQVANCTHFDRTKNKGTHLQRAYRKHYSTKSNGK